MDDVSNTRSWFYRFTGLPFHFVKRNYSQIFIPFLLISLFLGCSKGPHLPHDNSYKIQINGKNINVEVASSSKERRLGLMFRDELEKDNGMLFVFTKERYLSFWMKNTKIPLSLAFIGPNGIITQIEPLSPFSLISHTSKDKVRFALEMEKGWFENNGITVGDKVAFPPEIINIATQKVNNQ